VRLSRKKCKPPTGGFFMGATMQKPKPMKRDEIEDIISTAIEDAVSYVEADITEERQRAMRYFNGEVDIGHEEGWSKAIATKCRDVVRAIKPSLMRVFMASDKPVEFMPRSRDDVEICRQVTEYADYKFKQKNGYRLLLDVIHDALVQKTGIIKVYFEDYSDVEIEEYSGLTAEELTAIVMEEGTDAVDYDERETEEGFVYDVKISREDERGDLCFELIAPEDFFINSEATGIDSFYVVGHSNDDARVGDVVKMGYDFEKVVEHAGDENDALGDWAEEERNNGYTDADATIQDPSMRKVRLTEAYMRMDIEGLGIPKLYRFICIGTDYTLLDYELVDEVPFAVFEIDPEPHTFFGRSLVELVIEDQDIATSLLRGLLDNVALSNNPPIDVIDGQVNMEDVLANERGQIRRVKSLDAIRANPVPFSAGHTLPALEYYNNVVEEKTGVTRASQGLDPDTLQNATAAAVNATVNAATAQPELMARNLAEGGMKQLFKLVANLTKSHVDREIIMRLDGQFQPVDPRSWSVDMDMIVNVGLGTGGVLEREKTLQETLQNQMQVWTQYGPTNGLVTLTQIRNTLADLMKIGGVHNVDRYWMPMSIDFEKQLMAAAERAQQQAAQGPDPYIQGEQIKAQQRMQEGQMKIAADQQKAAAEFQMKLREMAQKDDLERDKMIQELLVDAAKIFGEYGTRVETEQIRAMQAANNQR
jgi:hypothetical protein